MKIKVFLIKAALVSIAIVGIHLLNAILVFYLWNLLMPDLFLLSKITYLQAFGLVLLAGHLFKSSRYKPRSILSKRIREKIDAL